MPLARIITTSAKYSNGLADDLRSRGFQVLTSAPGDSISESADLEITLKECLADEARGASDTAGSKDMRVFLTPQAFAGKIRSIEMFVLTPKRVAVEKSELALPLAPRLEPVREPGLEPGTEQSSPLTTRLEFAAPAEVAFHPPRRAADAGPDITAAEFFEDPLLDRVEEKQPPAFAAFEEVAPAVAHAEPHGGGAGGIGRAILASKQSAWPDMAEMKLVPAELAPAPVRFLAEPLHLPHPPERIPVSSSHPGAQLEKRFWRVPMVAGIAAVLALSAVWLANHFSASHPAAGTTFQSGTPSSVEAATAGSAAPAANPGRAGAAPSPAAMEPPQSARKWVPVSSAIKTRGARPKVKRHYNPDDDYVAKDTTVYFSRPPAASPGSRKSQARR